MMIPFRRILFLSLALSLSACSAFEGGDASNFPKTDDDRRKERVGKLTGEDGLVVLGPSQKEKDASNNPLGVNSFLWRATLDTLAFLPFENTDPWGGVVTTEWYEDPQTPGERFKVTALILDRQLRADSLKVTAFRQIRNAQGAWQDAPVETTMGRTLEDTILTRARQLRVAQLGY